MQTLVANISDSVRRESVNGIEYLIAPVTMIVPGVLNGSQGPLTYTAVENKRSAEAGLWENLPLTDGHPYINGEPVEAKRLPATHIGFIRNASTGEDGRLKVDAYFDLLKVKQRKPTLINSLLLQEAVEVSTGLGVDKTPGNDGAVLAVNYRPDHLAVLTDEPGACSVSDGCGVFNAMTVLSFSEIEDKLRDILRQRFPSQTSMDNSIPYQSDVGFQFVESVYPNTVIYKASGSLWKIGYKRSGNTLELSGNPVEVVSAQRFKPAVATKSTTIK